MINMTMKPILMMLGLSLATFTADAHLVSSRTVLNNKDSATVTVKFKNAVSGDLYLATSINGELYFFTDQGKTITKKVVAYQKNGSFSDDLKLLDVSASGIPANRYPLYQVVANPGSDPLNFTNWVGGLDGLNKMSFAIGLSASEHNDKNDDGFDDDDSDHDGYRDVNHADCSKSKGKDDNSSSSSSSSSSFSSSSSSSSSDCKPSTTPTPVPTTTPVPTSKPSPSPVPSVSPTPSVSPNPTPNICGSRLCLTQ